MTSILENELVRTYFGRDKCLGIGGERLTCDHPNCISMRVLRALEEPIKKGQLTLERFPSNPDNEWQVMMAPRDFEGGVGNHPAWLLLPSRFQPSSEEKECKGCCPCHHDTDCPNYQPLPIELEACRIHGWDFSLCAPGLCKPAVRDDVRASVRSAPRPGDRGEDRTHYFEFFARSREHDSVVSKRFGTRNSRTSSSRPEV